MEPNWLAILILSILGASGVYLAKVWFKRWLNPLSLYSAIWAFSLGTYELRLIEYYPISLEAWIGIMGAWVCIYLGSASVLLLRAGNNKKATALVPTDPNRLKKAVVVLTIVGGIGILDQGRVLIAE